MLGNTLIFLGVGLLLTLPILRSIEQLSRELRTMADLEAGAIADLSAAVDSAVALITKLAADLKAAGSPIDHSADIEALKAKLSDAVAAAAAPTA
jgi:hypothetical protein